MRTSTDTSGWYYNYAVAHKAWVWVHRTGEDVIISLDDELLTLAIKSWGDFLPVISSVYMSLTSLQLSHSINLRFWWRPLLPTTKAMNLVLDSFHNTFKLIVWLLGVLLDYSLLNQQRLFRRYRSFKYPFVYKLKGQGSNHLDNERIRKSVGYFFNKSGDEHKKH